MKKKLKKLGLVVVITVLTTATPRIHAMTVNWGAAFDTFLTLQGGTTGAPSGGLLQLGILNVSEATMQANQGNPLFLDANFTEWTTSVIGSGTGIDGSFDVNSVGAGNGFFNVQAYLLVFNTANAASATQVGLYTNPNWIFPASDLADPANFELSDGGLSILIGSFSAGTVTTPEDLLGGNAVQLYDVVIVPEPSTVALAGFGVLGLVALIRRRRS